MDKKKCLECKADFCGRIDKKFCSDLCRNVFNNRLKSQELKFTRQINNILKRNRKILAQCNPSGKTRLHRDKLLIQGFNFSYFTNIYKTRSGKEYFFCYEQGYLLQENDFVRLVVREEYVE